MLSRFIQNVKNTVKGGVTMFAMMFALNIVNDNFNFSKVPPGLKKSVKKQLELMGLDEKTLADLLAK